MTFGRTFDEKLMEHLEAVKSPSDVQQGQLAALRVTASADADQRRVHRLSDRWSARLAKNRESAKVRADEKKPVEPEFLR